MDTNKALSSVTTLSDVEGLCVTYAGKEGSSDPGVAVKVQNFTKNLGYL
jgi:N-acetylgalactosamine kinase